MIYSKEVEEMTCVESSDVSNYETSNIQIRQER